MRKLSLLNLLNPIAYLRQSCNCKMSVLLRYKQNVIQGCELGRSNGLKNSLCGGNGTGKTTLLKLVMDQLSPTSGYVNKTVD